MITDIRNLIAARRDEENDEGGFTLIELLIVIVVLGILAAIVVFAVQNLTGSSATSACKTEFKTVEVGTEAHKAQVGTWPANTAALTQVVTLPDTTKVGPWLKSEPTVGPHYTIAIGTNATAGATAPAGGIGTAAQFPAGTVLVAKGAASVAGDTTVNPAVPAAATFQNLNATPLACNDLP